MKSRLLAPAFAVVLLGTECGEVRDFSLSDLVAHDFLPTVAVPVDRLNLFHTHSEALAEFSGSVSAPISASGSQQERDVYELDFRPVFDTNENGSAVLAWVDVIGVPRYSASIQQMHRRVGVDDAMALLKDRCGFREEALSKLRSSLARGELNKIGGHEVAATFLFNERTLREFGLTFRPV